jgi:hypothetical protein
LPDEAISVSLKGIALGKEQKRPRKDMVSLGSEGTEPLVQMRLLRRDPGKAPGAGECSPHNDIGMILEGKRVEGACLPKDFLET